jgi:hypothetical protein
MQHTVPTVNSPSQARSLHDITEAPAACRAASAGRTPEGREP